MPSIEPDSIRARYDQVSPTYDRKELPQVAQRLYWLAYEHLTMAAVDALLPADRPWHILDAGGGSGKYGVLMAKKGHHLTVLDISPGMIEQARARFTEAGLLERARFEVGSILELSIPDRSFDLVFCEGDPVSYCVDQYPRAMAELVRVAKPGAPVILGLDNRQEHFTGVLRFGDKARALDILLTSKSLCPYGLPVHTFTEPELRAGMEAAGAQVEEIFGKPVLFYEMLEAMKAARGPGFDPWEARQEILDLQQRIAHQGFASSGGHFQVMARRRIP